MYDNELDVEILKIQKELVFKPFKPFISKRGLIDPKRIFGERQRREQNEFVFCDLLSEGSKWGPAEKERYQ
jgi:hypothetical protein